LAYIETVSIEDATGKVANIYQAATRRTGGAANIIKLMSRDGDSAAASMGLYASIMKSENSLTKARREMMASVVSNANDCFY